MVWSSAFRRPLKSGTPNILGGFEEALMTNEQMERKMEFIVETLARVAVNDEKHEMRLSRLERIAKLMVGAGLRERRRDVRNTARLTISFLK